MPSILPTTRRDVGSETEEEDAEQGRGCIARGVSRSRGRDAREECTEHSCNSCNNCVLTWILERFRTSTGRRSASQRKLLPVEFCLAHVPAGGCQPTRDHRARAATMSGWFMRSAMTVARPTGVAPSTRVVSAPQAKWSLQRCTRGLKRATVSPVSGSSASVALALNSLQELHARQTFSKDVAPLFEIGRIWS